MIRMDRPTFVTSYANSASSDAIGFGRRLSEASSAKEASSEVKKTSVGRPILIFLVLAILAPSYALAKREYPEKWYQKKWCQEQGGPPPPLRKERGRQVEVVLPDRTRCDCLTKSHAIEFGFAKNWAEAIGQSLYYSLQTGKKADIVLISQSI